MSDDRVIRNMRNMAWERAKGEMQAMLHTYWDNDERFSRIKKEMEDFIRSVEDNGLTD